MKVLTTAEGVEIIRRDKSLMAILDRLSLTMNRPWLPYHYTATGGENKPSRYYQRLKRRTKCTTTVTERVLE